MFPDRGLALASESGVTDADYVLERKEHLDAAFLGGLAVDEPTRRAAVRMVDRDRKEFTYSDGDPIDLVSGWLSALETERKSVVPGVNVRATKFEPLRRVADIVNQYGAVLEINAHCRQSEMVSLGCGHGLLRDLDRLSYWVSRLTDTGVKVGVKTRVGVVDDVEMAKTLEESGCSYLHVDCMDSPEVVDKVTSATDLFFIANNGVRSHEDARDYFERGADMVSTARGGRRTEDLRRIKRSLSKNGEK
ncbi:MAG: tRNA-dihydrouridine synthase [Halobacteria archaeon]